MTEPVTLSDGSDEAIEDAVMAAANAQFDAGQGIPQAVMGAWLLSLAQGERVAPMFATDPADYDSWFSAKVREAIDDPCEPISSEDVEAHFAERRLAALNRIGRNESSDGG